MDADTARTLAKVMSNSIDLADYELLQFDAFAVRLIRNTNTRIRYFELGLFNSDGTNNLDDIVCFYFNNEVGRAYLKSPAIGSGDGGKAFRDALQKCDGESEYLDFMRRALGTESN